MQGCGNYMLYLSPFLSGPKKKFQFTWTEGLDEGYQKSLLIKIWPFNQ